MKKIELKLRTAAAHLRKRYRRYRHCKQKTIVVIGDSHVNFFGGSESISWKPISTKYRINICPYYHKRYDAIHIGGGLAYKANHKKSSTKFSEKIEWLVENFLQEGDTIIFSLGEIDIRVHVYKQVKRQKRDYEEIIDEIIENYVIFLRNMVLRGYNVCCWGPIASMQEENTDIEYGCEGTETDRNKATAYFNKQLEEKCKYNQIKFLSIYKHLVTDEYKTKNEYFTDGCHLSQRAWELFEECD